MHSGSLRSSVVCLLVVAGLASCTGDGEDPPPTPPSSESASTAAATSTTPTTPADGPSVAPSTPSPTPSPTPAIPSSGTGTALLALPDGNTSEAVVGGDCMVSGPALPEELTGDARQDDVEVLIGVDNFVGPLGQPDTDRPLVVIVDGEVDDATVQIEGGPVGAWAWWEGSVGTLELADPTPVDGVTHVRARLTAAMERAQVGRFGGPAPRPPTPSPGPGRSSATPGPATSPTAAGLDGGVVTVAAVPVATAAVDSAQLVQDATTMDLTLELVCTAVP